MKKKNVSPQSLTKTDLEAVLAKYPTKDDLRNELKKYATKDDLKIEIKFKTEEVLTKVDENARKYRDQILNSNDKLAKQLETMREELGLENLQIKREIENHEERIKHLEKIQQTA